VASSAPVSLQHAGEVRSLCTLLVLQAVVSYRSVPAILHLLQHHTASEWHWQPHFTSVINWVLRLGLSLLNQTAPLDIPWVAIIDHSIDIGTKKALVVLRVPLHKWSGALRRSDCECIGLDVAETVNGETIRDALTPIFQQAGCPVGIIKDGDATLNKGIRLWREQQPSTVEVMDDLSHVVANALKKQYEGSDAYQNFVSWSSQLAKKLRQTTYAFLMPPKLRKKGRFMSVGQLAKWGHKLSGRLDYFKTEGEARFTETLAGIEVHLAFIKGFAETTRSLSEMMQQLKCKGLNAETVEACRHTLSTLTDSGMRLTLGDWLDKHQAIQQRLGVESLPVSSDMIESLFGSFKHIMNRNPQADMNRSVLLIPALCSAVHLDQQKITALLDDTPHKQLQAWEQTNIPYTLRKKRREAFQKKAKSRVN